MFTMESTEELKSMLKAWKENMGHPMAKDYITAIKAELKLRKG